MTTTITALKNPPKIYICGPMRGILDFNHPVFYDLAKHFRGRGFEVRSPAEKDIENGFDGNLETFSMTDAMQWDLESVLWADFIGLLPGWENSMGSAMETAVARATGKAPLLVEGGGYAGGYVHTEYTWSEIAKKFPNRIKLDIDRLLGITQKEHESLVQVNNEKSPLLEALDLVHGNRGANYGHPKNDFERTGKIWESILGIPVSPEKVAMCMIGVKLSRLVNTPDHHDSIVDIAGYAETLSMVLDRKNEEKLAADIADWLNIADDQELHRGPFFTDESDLP